MTTHDYQVDISPRFAWNVMIASIALVLISPLLGHSWYYHGLLSEHGIIENATVLFLVVAIVSLVAALCRHRSFPREVVIGLVLLMLASVFFAGEEADWGQVWFTAVETPETIADINREGQFNLHKIDAHRLPRLLFNVGPRFAATLCMLAFAALPFIAAQKGWYEGEDKWASVRYWLLPRHCVVPAALVAVLTSPISRFIKNHIDNNPLGYLELALRKPSGEFKEYCIAMGIMFYAWSVYRRARHCARGESPGAPPA